MKYAFAAITTAAVLLCAPSAFASNHSGEAEFWTAFGLFSTTTYGFPATTTTGGIAIGVYLTVAAKDDGVGMKNYLERNAVAVRADVSLGAGDSIDDLATAYRVPESHRAEFAKLMRRNRGRLLELADPDRLTAERAQAFTRLVYVLGRTAGFIDADFARSAG